MAEDAIDQPRWAIATVFGKLTEGNFHLVNAVIARLVDARRLACRPEKEAGEQVRQRRMIVPIGHETTQQVGAAQNRAVGRGRPAEDKVVAAERAGVLAVELKLLGAQPREARLFVKCG